MLRTLIVSLLCSAAVVRAADAPAMHGKNWWTDFSISPYGAVTHPNFEGPKYGAGLDVGYNINHTVSLHVANLTLEDNHWRGQAIDETSILFRADLIRDSKERFVAYVLGGGDRSWDNSDWAFGVGVGAEVRFTKNVSVGVDSRIRSWFKQDKDVQTRAYLGFKF